ncbi:MAG: DUF3127 domain-containing protein [Rikenellaceae bacterium]
MEFEGTLFKILPAASGTSARGEWQRQEAIFDVLDGQYVRKVVVTFFNKEAEVKSMVEGQAYTVSINLESREYNGRWYTNVNGWRVQPKQVAAPAPAPEPMPSAMPPMPSATISTEPSYGNSTAAEEIDDLPF